jgi:Bacterial Ig domain
VNAENDPPTAAADNFIVLAGRTLNVAAPGVLINDDDIDDETITAVKGQSPAHGVLTLAADGSFSYTPVAGFTGQDGFSYTAFDGEASSPTRIVTLQVTPIPPGPTPTPVPTAVPTPTPVPATPTPEPSVAPSPSASLPPTIAPSVGATVAPSPSIIVGPSPTAVAGPASGEDGVSTPVLIVMVLLLILLAFGAAFYGPKWLRAREAGAAGADGADGEDRA